MCEAMREMTIAEVEDTLETIRKINNDIATIQARYGEVAAYHQQKIERAKEICDEEITAPLSELETLTRQLRRYAETNITGKKRSLELPSGTLSFRKRQPIFYLGDAKVTSDNPALIELARNIDDDLVKVKTTETADWATLKKRLTVADDGTVYVNDTGEIVADMRAQILPDDFNVETA